MNSWTLRARSRTDPREKMRSGSRVALNSRAFAFFTRARTPATLYFIFNMCTYDTFMGDQWRAVATVRRSEGENVIPISKMQVHLSTSYVETQDIHTKAPASRVNLLGMHRLFHITHTHTNAWHGSHLQSQLLQFFQNNSFSDTEGITNSYISEKCFFFVFVFLTL